jgi:hypothetical protein
VSSAQRGHFKAMLLRFMPLVALLAAAPAAAQTWRAEYAMTLAGVPVVEAQITFDLSGPRYLVETRVRSRGVAVMVSRGEQVTRSEGTWRGDEPVPLRYASQGTWRGAPRQVLINYEGGEPRVAALVPAEDTPRSPIPGGNLRGTVDSLAALAGLARIVDRTGRCEARTRMFDGRRLTLFTSRTSGQEEGGLRCTITSQQVGGIPLNRDPAEAGQPQATDAWFARPQADGPAIPLRVDLATRWWGRVEAKLIRLERVAG